MKTILTVLILSALLISNAAAQEAESLILEGKDHLEQGYNAGDLTRILKARAVFERAAKDDAVAGLGHYYAALAEQRAVNVMWSNDEKQAADHLESAIIHAKKSAELQEDWAEVHALLSQLYGQKSALNPLKAVVYGPRAGASLDRAARLEPDNPRIALVDGTSLYHKPSFFGGSKEKALATLQRATELFESVGETDPLAPTWGHDEAYAWIGIIHLDQGDTAAAEAAFERALEINPDNGWVKTTLMPQASGSDGAQ